MHNTILSLMDTLFDNSNLVYKTSYSPTNYSFSPALNLKDCDKYFEISLPIPGIKIEDINMEVADNTLTINYKKNRLDNKKEKEVESSESELPKFLKREYYDYTDFSRSISLPKNIEQDSIKAVYKSGILFLRLNKKEEVKPKKISIEIES